MFSWNSLRCFCISSLSSSLSLLNILIVILLISATGNYSPLFSTNFSIMFLLVFWEVISCLFFSSCFYFVLCSCVVEYLVGGFNHLLSFPWLNFYVLTSLLLARLYISVPWPGGINNHKFTDSMLNQLFAQYLKHPFGNVIYKQWVFGR
jgi:hypothetical protein